MAPLHLSCGIAARVQWICHLQLAPDRQPSPRHTDAMEIRIEAVELPGQSCGPSPDVPDGYQDIHVGVQRRGRPDEVVGLTPGDAPAASWSLAVRAKPLKNGMDFLGPFVQGPPNGRFIYLNWLHRNSGGDLTMFRRAKLWLDGISTDVANEAVLRGVLVGRLGLTDLAGNPRCASVRTPVITWSASDLAVDCRRSPELGD